MIAEGGVSSSVVVVGVGSSVESRSGSVGGGVGSSVESGSSSVVVVGVGVETAPQKTLR